MADYYTKARFAETAASLGEHRAAFLAAFPPVVSETGPTDPFSRLLALFDDPNFLGLGLDDFDISSSGEAASVSLSGEQVECGRLAEIIRRCCPGTLAMAPICFEVALDCSRPRIDAYGGAAYVIFADHVASCGTYELIDRLLADPHRFVGREPGIGRLRTLLARVRAALSGRPA